MRWLTRFNAMLAAGAAVTCFSAAPTSASTRITFTQAGFGNGADLSEGVATGTFLFSGEPEFFRQYTVPDILTASINFKVGTYNIDFGLEHVSQVIFIPFFDYTFLLLQIGEVSAPDYVRYLSLSRFEDVPSFVVNANGLSVTTEEFVSFTVEQVAVTPPAVPEPASWAMMLLGFGMVSASLRYRRQSTKVAYAGSTTQLLSPTCAK